MDKRAEVSRGIVDKYPLRIARFHVDITGLPNDACVNLTYLLSDGRDRTALASIPAGHSIGRVQEVQERTLQCSELVQRRCTGIVHLF